MVYLAAAILLCLSTMIGLMVYFVLDRGNLYIRPVSEIAFGWFGMAAFALAGALAVWVLAISVGTTY